MIQQEDKERKRIEDLQRKTENKALAEEEIEKIAPKPQQPKITAYQIQVILSSVVYLYGLTFGKSYIFYLIKLHF